MIISGKLNEWHGMDDASGSLKILMTKDWLKLQAQDSSFYILVIQDHIESLGKPILSRRDEVLLNEFLAPQCLVICSKIPQPLSHFHTCPKSKVKLGPTEMFYPAPPSSLDIATARNPSHFNLTDGDLSLTEMGLQTLCFPLVTFRSHRKSESVPPRLQCKLSVFPL